MSYAMMPLSDYKAACDKVREKVDLTIVKFEDTDFRYIRSVPFTIKGGKTYTLKLKLSDSSLFYEWIIMYPSWAADDSPWIMEYEYKEEYTFSNSYDMEARLFINIRNGLTINDIISASIECDGEVVANFVEPKKIKSGELADTIEDVFEAGQKSMVDESKIIEETIEDKYYVRISAVSEIPHKISVKLSSDVITDFTDTEIRVMEKNLWNPDSVVSGCLSSTGVLTVADPTQKEVTTDFIPCTPNQVCTLYGILTRLPTSGYQWYGICFYDANKNFIVRNTKQGATNDINLITLTTTAPANTAYMRASARTYSNAKLQLEYGALPTQYETFKEDIYNAKADGSCEIDSLSPNMIISTMNKDINIKTTYHKSWGIYNFWKIHQMDGKRRNYSSFCTGATKSDGLTPDQQYWTDEIYHPVYPIITTTGYSLFGSNLGITDTKVPIIIQGTMDYAFGGARYLKTIHSLDLTDCTGWTSTFYLCYNLENITFVGTIPIDIGIQYSGRLTRESLISLITALKDYSDDTSGKVHKLVLHKDSVAKLTEEEKALVANKGWTLST